MRRRSRSSPPRATVTSTAELPCSATPTAAASPPATRPRRSEGSVTPRGYSAGLPDALMTARLRAPLLACGRPSPADFGAIHVERRGVRAASVTRGKGDLSGALDVGRPVEEAAQIGMRRALVFPRELRD